MAENISSMKFQKRRLICLKCCGRRSWKMEIIEKMRQIINIKDTITFSSGTFFISYESVIIVK
jgi:hypothetical protein